MTDKPKVSIVIPAYNESPCLERLYNELTSVCDMLPFQFEFLFVNDGSTDDSEEVLAALGRRDERGALPGIVAGNFGHQGALSAGMAFAAGDAVIMMDADLQHPPSVIPRLLECWEDGYEVVNTVRIDTENRSLCKRICSAAFYRVFRTLTGFPIERGCADFRLMSREPLDALNGLPERHRFIRGLVPWLGFRQISVPFPCTTRFSGRPKYTFRRSMRLALDGVTAFSLFPLRLVALFGLLVVAATFAAGVVVEWRHVFGGQTISGWTALLLSVQFFGGCQLASLGILGEYLGRTLGQVMGRPLFIVRSGRSVLRAHEHGKRAISEALFNSGSRTTETVVAPRELRACQGGWPR